MSLTGGVAFGYQSTTTTSAATASTAATETAAYIPGVAAKDNAKASGFGMDTAAIKLTVTEDLGGGLKATGVISAGGLARGNAVAGEDMSLTVAGGFGSVLVGQIEIGSGIRGLAQAGAPVNNMEGEVLAAASAGSDIVKYTAPAMNGFTFSGSLTENKGIATGLEAGATNVGASAYTVGAAYANGPLNVALDTTNWNSKSTAADSRYRLSANYNLGVATVGAGMENQKLVGGGTNKYSMVGVSAPVSAALTVGAAFVKNDTSATAGTKTGSTFGASYALSKRTSLIAHYATWESAETDGAAKNKKTTVLLNHSF